MNYNILINDFNPPKAKIDYLSFNVPPPIWDNPETWSNFEQELSKHGCCAKLSGRGQYVNVKTTIHDPSLEAIQFLIDEYPDTTTHTLEIAIDFFLKDGSNDPARLVALHDWLKRRLYPQRHEEMQTGFRKFYDESNNSIQRDTLETRSSDKTIYWADSGGWKQVRLYIKTKTIVDGKPIPITQHSVRLEVTLFPGGCQNAKVHQIGLIPDFAVRMRRYLFPFLNVAKGIKPQIKRTRTKNPTKAQLAEKEAERERKRVERHWKRYGAAWAAKHGYKIVPDADTNRLIGSGLKGLQDDLKRLKLTKKVVEYHDYPIYNPKKDKGVSKSV
jgi:hypothetical protein